MINEIIDKELYSFYDEIDSWEDAIYKSCDSLIAKDIVDSSYPKKIIETVEKYGPYIVLIPGVAMPHCQENAKGVKDTAVSFTKFEKPVAFDVDDRDKDARIFFTIASENPDEHLANISQLSDILCNEEIVEDLLMVKNVDDLREVQKKYNI
jgi:PTS system, IIA component